MAAQADLLNDQAAQWFVRQQDGLDERDKASFELWLDDPSCAVAYARVEAAWDRSARLKALYGSQPAAVPVLGSAQSNLSFRAPPAELTRRAAMVTLTVGAGAGAAWWTGFGAAPSYATTIGERRQVRLDDGSEINLNTDSGLTARISSRRRTVELVRGEAFFNVVPDAGLPFDLSAGRVRIVADAAAFNVRLRHDRVELVVGRGTLAFSSADFAERRIEGGAGVRIYADAVDSFAVSADELEQRIAWRRGMLEFNGETLAQAVAEFNRYRRSQIVIADPGLSGMRIGGTFQIDDGQKFVDSLAMLGVTATVSSGATVYLSAAPDKKL